MNEELPIDVSRVIKRAQNLKREIVTNDKYPGEILPMLFTGYRGDPMVDPPVCSAMAQNDMDCFVETLGALLLGMGLDYIVVAAESRMPLVPNNPDTGVEWEPGDLEFLINTEPEKMVGLWSDCVVLHLINRSGDWKYCTVEMPYQNADGEVTFNDDQIKISFLDESGVQDEATALFEMIQDTSVEQDLLNLYEQDGAEAAIERDVYDELNDKYGFSLVMDALVIQMIRDQEGVASASLLFAPDTDRHLKFDALADDPDIEKIANALGITTSSVNWKTRTINVNNSTGLSEEEAVDA